MLLFKFGCLLDNSCCIYIIDVIERFLYILNFSMFYDFIIHVSYMTEILLTVIYMQVNNVKFSMKVYYFGMKSWLVKVTTVKHLFFM